MENILELQHIEKSFGEKQVLRDISLTVKRGEFITFLGPSGCGKTTMLRIISGLLEPDNGSVLLEGVDVTSLAPEKRSVNTIFQNYALFPHMNVEKNIAYGLKIRHVPKDEQHKQVKEMLALVRLEGYERKMPSTLSGGEKQRVAIARAAINRPSVLLLDEPLGALDLQLRKYLQTELKRIQRKLGITFIYITHDQEEAMNMSDRIVVMSDGKFEQIGTPREVYDFPKTVFAAKFVGMSNLLHAYAISSENGIAAAETEGVLIHAVCGERVFPGDNLTISVRSENIILSHKPEEGFFSARVFENTYINGLMRVRLQTQGGTQLAAVLRDDGFDVGQTVYAGFKKQNAVVVAKEEAR